MTHEEDLKRVGACQGSCGNCPCSIPAALRDPDNEYNELAVEDTIDGWTRVPEKIAPYTFTVGETHQLVHSRHPSSKSFVNRVMGWVGLHDRKQLDYGSDVDPFANIREGARQLGLPAWIGCVIRMNDKMRRLNTAAKQYIETGQVSLANEGVIDSFDDLGVYSGIGAVVFEEES